MIIKEKAYYSLIEAQRQAIEVEFEWRELPDKKESRISKRLECDPRDQRGWREQHEWLFDQIQLFHETFARRIKALPKALPSVQ